MNNPKNIVIDARWITPTPSGIGVYTRELMQRLPLLEPSWKWHFLFKDQALADRTLSECNFPQGANIKTVILPYGIFSLKNQLRLPSVLASLKCDLFHSPNFMVPYFAFGSIGTVLGLRGLHGKRCGKCITTIHDAIPLLLKEYAPRSKKSKMLWLYRECMRGAVRVSNATITGSRTAKTDISSSLGLSKSLASSVRAIYDGVSDRFSPSETDVRSNKKKVVLYVGRLDPYKNVPMLVDAFAQVRHKSKEPIHLLIIGPEDSRYPEAHNRARDRGLQNDVTFHHGATDADLLDAYRAASVLVNPSRYEGFGLPQLEAMKCGVPVICADGGSQREVTAGAAKVVPVGDAPALVSALEEVLFDERLRSTMIERGFARAMDFSWDKTAEETLRLYKDVIELPPGARIEQ